MVNNSVGTMSKNFDPYYQWLGISPKHRPPDHYRLLGLESLESTPEVIANAADRQMKHLRTYQAGPHAELAQEMLNELAAARVCLLNPTRKEVYDEQLRLREVTASGDSVGGLAFGEYDLLDQVDSSSSGQIFKARHRTLGRLVALKVLSQTASESRSAVERFLRKARLLAQLRHPHLAVAYDAGHREETYYLAMEYVDGNDLYQRLRGSGPQPLRVTLDFVTQAAEALAYVHKKGVVHRNVKPSNLLVGRDGSVRIVGWGLARILPEAHFEASIAPWVEDKPGRVLGTPDYMAPEQAQSAATVDARADIYSLGCTLYTLLTGKQVYSGKGPKAIVAKHREAPIPQVAGALEEASAELDQLLSGMLAKAAADRPSVEQVIRQLRAL